jgi:hypothetical protein
MASEGLSQIPFRVLPGEPGQRVAGQDQADALVQGAVQLNVFGAPAVIAGALATAPAKGYGVGIGCGLLVTAIGGVLVGTTETSDIVNTIGITLLMIGSCLTSVSCVMHKFRNN